MSKREVKWTKEQEDAIYSKNSNLLVAAAAGSGKTAVLVERIINKVIEEKQDIDRLLVVTFTNAAASEMKQRVLEAIYKKIEEMPENIHLQRQINLLNKASICTIHSFCLDVIKNNFYVIDVSPNFTVADATQIELLKQEVLEDLFDEKYENKDESFLNLLNAYTSYRDDEKLKELILKIYNFVQSSPFPKEWLNEKIEFFNINNENEDFKKSLWGKILLEELDQILEENRIKLKTVIKNLDRYEELKKYSDVISSDIQKIEELQDSLEKLTWDEIFEKKSMLKFDTWPVDKKINIEYKDTAKKIRDDVKKKINSSIGNILVSNSKQTNESLKEMYVLLNDLRKIIEEFMDKFALAKKEKNIVDFNDIEHFALNILVKNENGKIYRTEIAKKYIEKIDEIAIDEYQDSNLVQEYILKSISNGKNMFMVGDVKQSIYKFRQARPELFLEKYEKFDNIDENKIDKDFQYDLDDDIKSTDNGKLIKLFKNFRSRENVLDITNIVFENIMSKKLGDIDYNEEEFLYLGAEDYLEKEDLETCINIIDVSKNDDENVESNFNEEEIDETKEFSDDDFSNNDVNQDLKVLENAEIEAKFVAENIKKLINSKYQVYDRNNKCFRDIKYKDIAILLRTTSLLSSIYEKELSNLDIPVFSDTTLEYLDSMEIQTILSLLKIIDNPLDDISCLIVLRSIIGNFTDNELVIIRLVNKEEKNFFNLLELAKDKEDLDTNLKEKIEKFLIRLNKWKEIEKYKTLDELIWRNI